MHKFKIRRTTRNGFPAPFPRVKQTIRSKKILRTVQA